MFTPPFCPYRACTLHRIGPHTLRWYRKFGFHHTVAFGRVQRYRCRFCGRTFSRQTFALDYYAKRRIDYEQIFRQLRSTAGIRDLARNLEISRGSVENRLFRMAHWALAVHTLARSGQRLSEDLVADGFEGYLGSKYYPHHLNILIGKRSQYFYAMDYSTLRRKGAMTAAQRLHRAFLERFCRPDPKGIERSMQRLGEELLLLFCSRRIPTLRLFTDDHHAYRRAFRSHGAVRQLIAQGVLLHRWRKGTKEPGRANPLYSVNFMDRQLRKDIVNYVRSTVNCARNVSCLLERLCVYRLHHNFIKPYREQRPADGLSHGLLAGCDMERVGDLLSCRWAERPFASLLPLSAGERGLWYRLYRTPLKRRREYLPKYAWG